MVKTINKALTFRASSIGDCLMGKYLLENIHSEYPEARLGIVVGSRSAMIRDLFEAYPWIEIVEVNRRNPLSLWRLWRDWHGSNLIVTQYAGKPGGKFSFASKVVARILTKSGGLVGFTDASRFTSILYDKLVPFSISIAPAEHERKALSIVGIPITIEPPHMQFIPISNIERKLEIQTPFVIVHLFAGNKGRGLSPDKIYDLLRELVKNFPGHQLVVSGGPSDREEAEEAIRDLSIKVIAGETSLQELMNLISKSSMVVSVDTGTAHLAAQLGKPLVVLRTCLGPNWWNPEQYSKDAPVHTFSRADCCNEGHISKTFPDCLNKIDMSEVAIYTKETSR